MNAAESVGKFFNQSGIFGKSENCFSLGFGSTCAENCFACDRSDFGEITFSGFESVNSIFVKFIGSKTERFCINDMVGSKRTACNFERCGTCNGYN